MLRDRSQRQASLGDINRRWTKLGEINTGDHLAGPAGFTAFVHAGREQSALKTKGAFIQLQENKTVLNPGQALNIPVEFARVSFAQHSFNPLSNQPSTAVFPVATFVPTIPGLDPDLRLLAGIVAVMEGLQQAVS